MYFKIKHTVGWEVTRRKFTESDIIIITGDPFVVCPELGSFIAQTACIRRYIPRKLRCTGTR